MPYWLRRHALTIPLCVAAGISLAVLLASLGRPLTDQHGFRQTQTAIAVYRMLHGGPWLDYEVPVLGAGWSVPFEFPLYQWLVAALVRLSGLPVDPAGRLVSYAWLVAAIWPAALLSRRYALPPATPALFATLLLLSPTYLFWGRAFLIETQAMTLGLAHVAAVRSILDRPRWRTAAVALLGGIGAALTKVTTWLPFGLLAAAMLLVQARPSLRRSGQWPRVLVAAAIVAAGPLCYLWWNGHADAVKAMNPIAWHYRSSSAEMALWNFGTVRQRFGADMADLLIRSAMDVVGPIGPLFMLALLLFACIRPRPHQRATAMIAVLVAAYLLPFAVFTNVHIVHAYYQAANAVFLVAALAVALAQIGETLGRGAMLPLLAVTMLSQSVRFMTSYAPSIARGEDERARAIGLMVRRATPPDSGVVGIGLSWSAVLPYYAERRALLEPGYMPLDEVRHRLADPSAAMGGLRVGAIVLCASPLLGDATVAGLLRRAAAGMVRESAYGCTVAHLPSPGLTRSAAQR